MKFLFHLLGQGYLILAVTNLIGVGVSSAIAQESTTISNTGVATFTIKSNPQTIPSNTVSVSATVTPPSLQIIKTGDRASAEPGDTIIYRLLIKNTGKVPVSNLQISDTLPLGIKFLSKSLQASLSSTTATTTAPNSTNVPSPTGPTTSVTLTGVTTSQRVVNFTYSGTLAPNQSLNVAYAGVLTPDSIRGTGRNAASVVGQSGNSPVRSNVATYLIRISPGILSDCGTIIGRVFVDKNFDGEQQPGEPGIPNAVIFFEDGTRVVTDANGLFSLAGVLPGNHTGTLDLSSLPGYTLAPNRHFIEQNSQSRLVRLAPGGLVRMNFGVTPAYGREDKK